MGGIKWNRDEPPATQQGKRLLLIASPTGLNYDAAADNRPDIYVGHFGHECKRSSTTVGGNVLGENNTLSDHGPHLNILCSAGCVRAVYEWREL